MEKFEESNSCKMIHHLLDFKNTEVSGNRFKHMLQVMTLKMFHKKKTYSLAELNASVNLSELSVDCKTLKVCDDSPNDIIYKSKPSTKQNPFLGFVYTFLTSVLITLTSVFVKKLSYIDSGQLSFVRNAGVFAGCLPIAIYSVKDVIGPRKDRIILMLRGFLGATSLYLNLTAFRYLPLAEAAVIMSTLPALTTIVAYFYLKESCGRVQTLGLLITLCGVLLSVRLPELLSNRSGTRFDSVYIGGMMSAVGCVIVLSFTFVTLRKMKDLHFSVPLLYFGFLGMIENSLISFTTSSLGHARCGWDQIFVMLIGIFGFIGHCTLTLAVQVETVGIVTVTKSSMDIIVAMILQTVFFNADIDVYNISGASLVILSVSMIGFAKWLRTLPEDSESRKKFKYFLL